MTLLRIVVNLVLIALPPIAVVTLCRKRSVPGLFFGSGSAVVVLSILTVIRTVFGGGVGDAERLRLPFSVDPSSWHWITPWMITVVVLEETAKYLAVRGMVRHDGGNPGRPVASVPSFSSGPVSPQHPRGGPQFDIGPGIAVGVGFATMEHLMYITAATGTIIARIATAGMLHVGTSVLFLISYAGPRRHDQAQHTVRQKASAGFETQPRHALTMVIVWLTAVVLHLLFNLAVRTLDQIFGL